MAQLVIPAEIQHALKEFVEHLRHPELIATYLFYIEKKYTLKPVLFVRDRIVFKGLPEAIKQLESEDKLWRETEIKIGHTSASVNDETSKIYICPYTGKVFGNNTHPNPQDAIYEWVSKCPENTERIGGLRPKRFFISEDPEVIKAYASKFRPKTPITKVVFSSALSGKLFHSKESVIEDFKAHYVKNLSLVEVMQQQRYQIEPSFMAFIEEQLTEDNIAAFVESLSQLPDFTPYVERWIGDVEAE